MIAFLTAALKFLIPIGAVAGVGTGAYYAYGKYSASSTTAQDLPNTAVKSVPVIEYVHLLVKATAPTDANKASGILTSADGTFTKNYHCQLQLDGVSKDTDKTCSLFRLNTADNQDSIELNSDLFENQQLEFSKDKIVTNSHFVLKLDKKIYGKFLADNSKNQIVLLDKANLTKQFGSFQKVSELKLNLSGNPASTKVGLFLAHAVEAATQKSAVDGQTLTCKVSSTKSMPCKIYKASDTVKKTNSLKKSDLTTLTSVPFTEATPIPVNTYAVVDLLGNEVLLSELHAGPLTVHQTTATALTTSDTNKVVKLYFDQQLYGSIASPSSATLFPIAPKWTSYLVKKGTTQTFSSIVEASKNYQCKFAIDANRSNYDNSCTIKGFPTESAIKVHSYQSIKDKANFVAIDSTSLAKDHFLLTVDSNKLFNLKPDWASTNVVLVQQTESTSQTADFTILQEVAKDKAIGKTNLVLLRYNTQSTAASDALSPPKNCALSASTAERFACTINDVTTLDLKDLSKTVMTQTATTTYANITKPKYFVAHLTEFKNISDFDKQSFLYFGATTPQNTQITFDIIALLGGENASGKTTYLLEASRIAE